ncbi:hypothetical protein AUJ62_01840 [Candidatus Pacearchaeota archaeon CG1_02_32_21]|nr:MAG: hypothetical protein AUJ62_01840 [Candidatus Pacearchaeota archaeon CG1_02_32_21]
MKCEYCRCELNNENQSENQSIAALDFGLDESRDFRYYCSAECLVTWVIGFSFCHFGDRKTNSLIKKSQEVLN